MVVKRPVHISNDVCTSAIHTYHLVHTYFICNDLFLYIAIDTVFHTSGIIQNGRGKLLHVQSSNYTMKIYLITSHWSKIEFEKQKKISSVARLDVHG